jgi:hypothetical protein
MIGGSPVVQKNNEALQAATAVLNYVAREGATLRAEHQTALTNAMGDATAIKNANDAYKVSKGILESQATAALAGLQGKAGAKTDKPGESAAPAAAGHTKPIGAYSEGASKSGSPPSTESRGIVNSSITAGKSRFELERMAEEKKGQYEALANARSAPGISPAQIEQMDAALRQLGTEMTQLNSAAAEKR